MIDATPPETAAARDARCPDNHGVHLVPAFVGLGAPHWRAGCTGAHRGSRSTPPTRTSRARRSSRSPSRRSISRPRWPADGARRARLHPRRWRHGRPMTGSASSSPVRLDAPVERPAQLEHHRTRRRLPRRPRQRASGRSLARRVDLGRCEPRSQPAMPAARRTELVAGWRTALDARSRPEPRSRSVRIPGRAQRPVAEASAAMKKIVSRQHATIVVKTPLQPQRSAIQPTPVPAIAEPNT